MENIECEVFCYTEKEFEREIMLWFEFIPAINLKENIDIELETRPKCFRMAVYRRLLNFKNQKDWFISMSELTPFEKEQERDELLTIWKMGIEMTKDFYLNRYESKYPKDEDNEKSEIQKAIDSWFYETLTENETKLEKGEINEQQYIIICNNMKHDKRRKEDLLSACVCSAIGRQNKARIGGSESISDMFRIICMPCGFLG